MTEKQESKKDEIAPQKGQGCKIIEYNTESDIKEFEEAIGCIKKLSSALEEIMSQDLAPEIIAKINESLNKIENQSSNPREVLKIYIGLIYMLEPELYKELLLESKIVIIQSKFLKDE